MPLKDAVAKLNIDDRTYSDIVDEIRTRVARYTPEWKPTWNDLNDSDPGVTLAQVFAWLAEMLIYRMNLVPELNYLKFLELIGVELTPAQPARAEVTFAVASGRPEPFLLLPKGSQVGATAEGGGPQVVFETERDLRVFACALRSVQSYDGAIYRDRSAENDVPADGFQPFGDLAGEGAALVLGLGFPDAHPSLDAFPATTIDLAFWSREQDQAPPVVQCGPASTRSYASARVVWEGWDGTQWRRLDTLADETLALTRTGHWSVRVPQQVNLQRDYVGDYEAIHRVTGAAQPKLFWLRARIDQGRFERPPLLRAVRLNTAPVLQAQTVRREVLGGASGRRNQRFQLANFPVIKDPVTGTINLKVTIDDGTGEREWKILEDLLSSGADDEHLAINLTSGELSAGDGENGAIPVANINNPDTNVIAVEYRFGGGKRGNVSAGAIRNLLTPVDGIDGGKTANLFAAFGGRDEEQLEDAKKRARRSLRSRERAVTPEDFELLAQQAGNVKRAKALPLVHPLFPGTPVPGAVTVIVVPDADVPNPVPSDGLLRTVCSYLDARRLLTTELFVVAPRYVSVTVRAQVAIRDEADPAKVKEDVERALTDYLHPLRGGDDGEGWPFGGALRYSKIVQRVFTVEGVDSVPQLRLVVDGEEQPECRDVAITPFSPHALVYSTVHEIEVILASEVEETA